MDILWAPWREAYVATAGKKKSRCVFCGIFKEKKDAGNFIFLRSRYCFSVLNIYPFNGGHSLVIPNRHVGELSDLSTEEQSDLMATMIKTQDLLAKVFKPQAFNIGMNIGRAAGAGIPEHLHVHIVPRWSGDVNFLPAIFDTKVMPVSLKKVYKALCDANKG